MPARLSKFVLGGQCCVNLPTTLGVLILSRNNQFKGVPVVCR